MLWVFEWESDCDDIVSKSFLWETNTTFGVLNLILGKNYGEILLSHVLLDHLGYLENLVPFPLIKKECCIVHLELEFAL